MRLARTTVAILALCGCSDRPVAPSDPTPVIAEPLPSVPVYLDVFEERADGSTGPCIYGATVEIVRGEGTGRSVRMGCADYWTGPWDGFVLPEGRLITLRASAPGYLTKEKTIQTAQAAPPDNFVFFALPKVQ